MLREKRTELKKLIRKHFDQGINRTDLERDIAAFIDKVYTDKETAVAVPDTNARQTAMDRLLNDIVDAGGYRLWLQELKKSVRQGVISDVLKGQSKE